MKNKIRAGPVHKIPADLRKVIHSSKAMKKEWENLTPLGRNEWICWVEEAKKDETRNHRIERTHNEIMQGKRRPCCWAGCIHR